nr:putative reverse transcriptase domain-containing protein [Tanacetum cinerariifolium]
QFLGHVINGDGIHVDHSKIEAVKNWKAPRTSSKVCSFLGLENAFQTLKDKLCNAPVLALFDRPEDFVVYCDASGLGLGCVLMKRENKVTAIEESKDLTSLYLDELIENLKVHEIIIKKDSKIIKLKFERKSLALNTKKESSDEECLTSG